MSYKSKRSKATDITQKTKEIVWERDNQCCIFCGTNRAMPNAHYISRASGGLGIEQNIITACLNCHRLLDQSTQRRKMLAYAKKHLQSQYQGWDENELKYRRY